LEPASSSLEEGQFVPPTTAPTRVRWRVVAMLAFIAGLTYLDRLNLGIVAKNIQEEFKFSTQTMGWILGSFSLGYAWFHIPGGWLADRFGSRRVLTGAVLWFSAFTMLTAVAPGLPILKWFGVGWAFAITRFLMGIGESAAMPVGNKLMGYWLGPKERGFGTSIFLAGVGGGGILAPILITWMAKEWGWRTPFFALGAAGLLAAYGCYSYVTDRPQENPRVNAAELALIVGETKSESNSVKQTPKTKVPWRKLFSTSSIWGLMISHFCLVYPVYIFFTWFFIYLVKVRGMTVSKASFWGSAPFVANIILVPLWGRLTDRAAATFGKGQGRRVTAWLGIGLSALLLFSGSHTSNGILALLQLATAAGFNFAASAVLWTTCNDVSKQFSGSISGIMTTFGSLGGSASPVVTAAIAERFGWTYALDFAAVVTAVSGLAWFFIDAGKKIE
jgi:ACS family glucarate transporter-like MFS transporter